MPAHVGIDMKSVRSSSPLWEALEKHMDGYSFRTGFRNLFAYLPVEGTFEKHLATLGKTRGHLKRFRRKLEAHGKLSVELSRDPELLSEFVALEASGWKGRSHSSIADNPKVMDFFKTLVGNLTRKSAWNGLP